MKKTLSIIALLAIVIVPVYVARALTLADVELLISLGILDSEQAVLAKQAIGDSEVTSTANSGNSIFSTTNSDVSCVTLTENMFLGSAGTAVGALQLFLQNEGHYAYPKITDYYGLVTQTAVVDFQLAQGLITSRTQPGAGSVGPLTRERVQQVSCSQANNLGTVTQAQQTIEDPSRLTTQILGDGEGGLAFGDSAAVRFARKQSGGTTEIAPGSERLTVTLDSLLTTEFTEQGVRRFRYDVNTEPDEDLVDYYIFTVVCDNNNVAIDREEFDETCGASAQFKPGHDGKVSFKMEYENTGGLQQTIGMGVEAYDSNDRLLGLDETTDELPEPKAGTSRNTPGYTQQQNDTSYSFNDAVRIPDNRPCSRREQLDYLRFIMTATVREGQQVPLPPTCLPGNVQCSFQSPPTYCEIVDGPNSGDLCSGADYFFYDGKCLPEEEVLQYR